MAVVQSTYTERHSRGDDGLLVNPQTCDVDSLRWEGATSGKFGYAVQQGTAEDQAMAGVAANTFRGILCIDKTLQPVQNDEFVQGDVASVVWRGEVWCRVSHAVTVGQNVVADNATGQLSSESGGARTAIGGARFMSAAGAGELAKVRLAGPVPAA